MDGLVEILMQKLVYAYENCRALLKKTIALYNEIREKKIEFVCLSIYEFLLIFEGLPDIYIYLKCVVFVVQQTNI